MQNDDNRFEINHSVNLEQLGRLAGEALIAFDEDNDACRDLLLEIHTQIYPNSWRLATPEEIAALAAMEPMAGNRPGKVIPLKGVQNVQ